MEDENDVIETFDGIEDNDSDELDTFENPIEEDEQEDNDEISQTDQIGEDDGKEDKEDDKDEPDSDDEDDSDSDPADSDVKDDAVFKVKIDGVEQEVSLQDLKNNFSGQKAVEKRFTDFAKDKRKSEREFVKREDAIQEINTKLTGHLDDISHILDDPRQNPLEALYYLIDLKGGNTVELEKRMMSGLENTFEEFSGMDETERELYWAKKQINFQSRQNETKISRSGKEQTERNSQAQLENLWETHEVSEDDYYDAIDELKNQGYEDSQIEPEKVVNYMKLVPIFDKASTIADGYSEELGEEKPQFIEEIAKALQNYPNLSEDDLVSFAAKNLGFDVEIEEDISDLERKAMPQDRNINKRKKRVSEDHIDSFDDFY